MIIHSISLAIIHIVCQGTAIILCSIFFDIFTIINVRLLLVLRAFFFVFVLFSLEIWVVVVLSLSDVINDQTYVTHYLVMCLVKYCKHNLYLFIIKL